MVERKQQNNRGVDAWKHGNDNDKKAMDCFTLVAMTDSKINYNLKR